MRLGSEDPRYPWDTSYITRISTTTDPTTDKCGLPVKKGTGKKEKEQDIWGSKCRSLGSDGEISAIDGKRSFESKHIFQLHLHPTLHSLIPSIMLNTSFVRVSLYDCTSDLLLLSGPVKILVEDNDSQNYYFASPAALFIWLFINHRYIDGTSKHAPLLFFKTIKKIFKPLFPSISCLMMQKSKSTFHNYWRRRTLDSHGQNWAQTLR